MKTLRYGSQGPFVQYLQLALRRAGFAPGAIDGIFGTRTLDALVKFQRAYGLVDDGIAGPLTWAALYPYLSGYTVHVARPGDSYFKLAKNYGTSVSAIETANPDIPADQIPVGAELVIPLNFSVVPETVLWSYAINEIVLDGLTVRYPFIGSRSAGTSAMDRQLSAVTIGSGSKSVFYNASHHANEWITTPVLWKFLEQYAAAYMADGLIGGERARQLYSRVTLHMLPLVNPDGVDLVTGALPADDSYYVQAKALAAYYPSIPFPSGWKANIRGVDLNLGYPAGWETAREIKFAQGYTRPGPRDYVGTEPLAEPENRATFAYTEANNFLLTLSYHTQGMVIYYKFLDYNPPRADEIGQALSKASGYTLETTPYASGFAGYKDWFIQTYNRPGYTIEAGQGENPLPLSQFPAIYRDNLGILTLSMALI